LSQYRVSVLTDVEYEVRVVSSALLSSLEVHECRLQWLTGTTLYLRAVHASDSGCWLVAVAAAAAMTGWDGMLVDVGRGLFGVGLNWVTDITACPTRGTLYSF
jgi:hypothetical protein